MGLTPRARAEEASPMTHIHLDPIGGLAGDMFVAAMLDAFPEHEAATLAAASALAGVGCQALRHHDGVMTGMRFAVRVPGHDARGHEAGPAHGDHGWTHDHAHDRHQDHGPYGHGPHDHGHAAWCHIRACIDGSNLPAGTKVQAIAIFELLAAAEARVHGIEPEAVAFHEVGAADSIADIVAAAFLIDAIGPARWSASALPLGSGRVRTAHGIMPVPAPATALLMQGFPAIDDGIPGERVTPTGAAILRHLCAPDCGVRGGRIGRSGTGFGTRIFPGLSNTLRVLVFETAGQPAAAGHRELAVIEFEVDDQSAEDLAAGLDHLRALPGVHDVLQSPVFGKKGRMATHVQVLARPDEAPDVTEACFRETTTIGLRVHAVSGLALPRRMSQAAIEGRTLRVKHVDRPGGATCKAEADDLRDVPGQANRVRLRREAENAAAPRTELA